MRIPRQTIDHDVRTKLEVSRLLETIRDLLANELGVETGFILHLDIHKDLLGYSDIQLVSYLCHSHGIPLSLSLGGCEANRDLEELASLNAEHLQLSSLESSFAYSKFRNSYDRVYNILQTPRKVSVGLLLNTPQSIRALPSILDEDVSRLIKTIVIDRNSLSRYYDDDHAIQLSILHATSSLDNLPKVGLCGGLSPSSSWQLSKLYQPSYLLTKMFRLKLSPDLCRDKIATIISAFLVLEVRVLDLIISHRLAMSRMITNRKDHLQQYIQLSTLEACLGKTNS